MAAKGTLKTTNKMVEDALIELHSAKGVTLKQVYSFISTNFNLEALSTRRIYLIKKHIKSLQETETVVNITGRGLSGHFQLANKAKFRKEIATNTCQAKEKAKTTKKATKNEINKNNKNSKQTNLKQTTHAIPNTTSMFDTPMLISQVRTSTPLLSPNLAPWAPAVHKRETNKKLPDADLETPRSSLPSKRRKI